MRLTIGMATYKDYDGVYFSVQALRMYHPAVLEDAEIIVVDNKPDSDISKPLENFIRNVGGRYIPMAEPQGTTQSRNRIFTEARGEIVVCMDSHVLLAPNSVQRLLAWYDAHPKSLDLISGPMLYDNLQSLNTHFDDVWRAEMWGVWGQAWLHPNGTKFTVLKDDKGFCDFRVLAMGLPPVAPFISNLPLNIKYGTHHAPLLHDGCVSLGHTDSSDAFEIPGMGLGLFTCRKAGWLGFNPHFRGFGGEEMYIHEKYRKAGRRNLCLPFLKWGHRFSFPGSVHYTPYTWNKIRNYVIGHLELGLTLQRIYDHFVGDDATRKFPKEGWDYLVGNPIARINPPGVDLTKPIPPAIQKMVAEAPPMLIQPGSTVTNEKELLNWACMTPRDLDQHLPKLAELAAQCKHVTELTHRRESTIALLAAEHVLSYNAEKDRLLDRMVDLFPSKLELKPFKLDAPLPILRGTDLLFIDTVHNADRLYKELTAYAPSVSRYIVLHDTQLYGEMGEGATKEKPIPGLLVGLRLFMRQNSEWSVVYHTAAQYGLTVLSCQDADKPKLPGLVEMAGNFTKAVADYTADGLKNVTKAVLEERLNICSTCPQRTNNRCAVCGCGLTSKAKMRSSECPLGFWPASPRETAAANV